MIRNMHRSFICLFLLIYSFAYGEETLIPRCPEIAATLEQVEGEVERQTNTGSSWIQVLPGENFCYGDSLRVTQFRAAIRLNNDTLVRLKEGSLVQFMPPDESFWLALYNGVAHFISRTPKSFKVKAPYVNAVVEGTEFVVDSGVAENRITVIEGKVRAENTYGGVGVTAGQQVLVADKKPPILGVDINILDSVIWSLYFPALWRFVEFDHPQLKSALIAEDTSRALELIRVNQEEASSRLQHLAAVLYLSVGDVSLAESVNNQFMREHPGHVPAESVKALIALAKGRRDEAKKLIDDCLNREPNNILALYVGSYVDQAQFDLPAAYQRIQAALNINKDSEALWTRLAELAIALGKNDQAKDAVGMAHQFGNGSSYLACMEAVVLLADGKVKKAKELLESTIATSKLFPMSHFILGLSQIKLGETESGRKNIELAVLLDPSNSLYRSYLGKAYLTEHRNTIALEQLALAKQFDPQDPTPYYYQALHYQSTGSPSLAVASLDEAIARNDNRAVYRSRMRLDSDNAARSANLAQIYSDIGLPEKAVRISQDSKKLDRSEYAPYKILADIYAKNPRTGFASASEYLQAQLRQPLSSLPIRPSVSENALLVMPGAGPSELGLHEFNPMFNKNQLNLLLSAASGNEQTESHDLAFSGLYGQQSFVLENYGNRSRGLSGNGYLEYQISSLYYQLKPARKWNLFFELKSKDENREDLKSQLSFGGVDTYKDDSRVEGGNIGLAYDADANFSLYTVLTHREFDFASERTGPLGPNAPSSFYRLTQALDSSTLDAIDIATHIDAKFGTIYLGALASDVDKHSTASVVGVLGEIRQSIFNSDIDSEIRYQKSYIYWTSRQYKGFSMLLGAADSQYDAEEYFSDDFSKLAIKAGLEYTLGDLFSFDLAYFEDLAPPTEIEKSLEYTQIFSITQKLDDRIGNESATVSARLDINTKPWFFSLSSYDRESEAPFALSNEQADIRERNTDIKLAATKDNYSVGLIAKVSSIDIENYASVTTVSELDTKSLGFDANWFYKGFSLNFDVSRVWQRRYYLESNGNGAAGDFDEDFSVVDVALRKTLLNRLGKSLTFSLEVNNLLDESFVYQNQDFLDSSTSISPYAEGRVALGKMTILF